MKNKMQTGFYIGRFQPFHKGHLSVVKKALSEVDRLIIGIGSAEQSYKKDNPFTAGERIEMITAVLDSEGIDASKYMIIPVRDINKYGMWVSHVVMLCTQFEVVYTGSPITKMLFEKHKEYEIRDVVKEFDISATKVRDAIINDLNWEEMVPCADYLKEIDGVRRIKDVSLKD